MHGDSLRGRLALPTRKPVKRKPAPKKPGPKAAPIPRPKSKPKTAVAARLKRRRQKVAAGLLAGKTVTKLAREEGVTRSHLSREANQPETRLLMAELLDEHRDQVAVLVAKALDRIDLALDAHETEIVVSHQDRTKTKSGHTKETRKYRSVLAGVDHYARMTAAKRLVEMITAAKTEDSREAPGTITWEAFLHLRERIQPA